MRLALALLLVAGTASADPASDANAGLQAFVAAAHAKALPAGVESFIAPSFDDEHAVAELDELAKIVPAPKLEILATHVAKSGTAAWIVAEISGAKYESDGNTVTTPLRASAFLTLDNGQWHVRAAQISGVKANGPRVNQCGMIEPSYRPPSQIASGAAPAVKVIREAFVGPYEGKGTSRYVIPALSDDPSAQMFGSAPGEAFSGGAAIKKVFKNWTIDLGAEDADHTRAGVAPGGDLAWVAMDISTMWQCTSYRALFVLQKEGSAWKIVHQHYSDTVHAP